MPAFFIRALMLALTLIVGVTSASAVTSEAAGQTMPAAAQGSPENQASPAEAGDISKKYFPADIKQAIHKTGFVQVNGANLYYEVKGSKAAARRFPQSSSFTAFRSTTGCGIRSSKFFQSSS